MLPITPNLPLANLSSIQPTPSSTPTGLGVASKLNESNDFGNLIQNFVRQTNADQNVADSVIEGFATGKTDNIQQVVLAMANADLSFQFFMEIRNKIIDSYNELMRMQF